MKIATVIPRRLTTYDLTRKSGFIEKDQSNMKGILWYYKTISTSPLIAI